MADAGFAMLNTMNSVVSNEPFTLAADTNPGVTSINNKIMMVRNFHAGKDPNIVWFKFIVLNSTEFSKEFLLRTFLDAVPAKFVPVKFHTINEDSIFYSKFCIETVMSIIRQNFTLRIQGKKLIMMLEVGTRDSLPEISINDLVALVVQRRVASSSNTKLDLSSFHSEPDLDAFCFFPLSLPNNLLKVIKCADHFAISPYVSVDISNNQIKNLSCFTEKLKNFENVRFLDLRNNQLASMSNLQFVTNFPLVELQLDGNPLCELYSKEFEYVKHIQKLFPSVKVLDGYPFSGAGYFVMKQVYFHDPQSKSFLEQFLTHYFSILDSEKRHLLFGLYHSEALFSITSTFLAGQSTSTNANLTDYINQSRNIKNLSDCEKIDGLLFKGTRQIMDAFKSLPHTQHDSSSFTADVLIFNPTCVKISVTGLFREPNSEFTSVRFFKRNFVLHYFNKVYLIINDMLHISNCTSEQAVSAFRTLKVETVPPLDLHLTTRALHISLSNEQKVKMVEKISDITNMNQEWCRRCLEDVQYDLRNALVYFQKHYAEKSVPSEAFIK